MSHGETEKPRPLLTVIIPVFDEAETLPALVERVSSVPIDMQIVAVDDGSTDGSSGILASLAANRHLEVIVHPENRGKGAAIRTALEHARGEIVVIQDADLEYNPEEFSTLLDPLTNGSGATVVYGSRFLGEAHQMSRWHWFGNHLVTAVFNFLYGTNLTD
ncbi:MAG: glycosyltransferase family 2 protein, partial [Thermomicrobiales bacterium]